MSHPGAGQPAGSNPPVCPRHPDTVAYVRCQRCGRPTCVKCQVPAAVGIQCVDCVREQKRSAPQRRSALGAKLRSGAPVVTYTLLGITIAAFVLQNAIGSFTADMWFVPILAKHEPYRFLSAAFVHAPNNFLHIAFNMYALWIIGPFLEAMLGRVRFIALYLIAAIGGSTAVLLLTNSPETFVTPVLGASGAIFGLFSAVLIVMRRIGREATQIFIVIALNVVIGFVVPGISWQGHFGGLVVGAILGALYAWAPPSKWKLVSLLGTAGTLALIIAVAVWKMGQLGMLM